MVRFFLMGWYGLGLGGGGDLGTYVHISYVHMYVNEELLCYVRTYV